MKFSVVIPTFNRKHSVALAVDSALSQDVADVEIVVVDDGSTDGTVEWLSDKYAMNPVRVLRNACTKGPAGARNTGIRAATGDQIAFLDSDDLFLRGHLREAAAAFGRFQELDVLFGRARYERNGVPEDYMGPNFERKLGLAPIVYSDDEVTIFGRKFLSHLLHHGCWFNLSTVVLRRVAAMELMNETLRISEDYEFWVRLAHSRRFGCLHRPQVRYTLHDQNISFEAAGSAADHAPRLLQALEVIEAHPRLTAEQRGLIGMQKADVLFDWAYRCRQRGRIREAIGLHAKSLRFGRRLDNLVAIGKVSLAQLVSFGAFAER